ncbi:homeobox-leucine zipper protein HDG11-like [Gastrolobium bilobum]|uniref:homeobox-leucine zipper protein HDG11-like n=1 Tax=Gastrolobium bilobum TaxID=150636 RepID=UPI002AB32829|nr:homeobox-leucine zipper protein HDG11-like [Gastrolobium bilobum]
MASQKRGGGGSGDKQDAHNSAKKNFHRHSPNQIAKLEAIFEECPLPDENLQRQIGEQLGLNQIQVKFWFQNKRTKAKNQSERYDNNALRLENANLQSENFRLKETLKNVLCSSCGGPSFGQEQRQYRLQKLRLENSRLNQEHETLSKLLENNRWLPLPPSSSYDPSGGSDLNQNIPVHDPHIRAFIESLNQNIPAPTQTNDQIISPLASAIDEDISTLEQEIPLPFLDLDFGAVSGVSNDDMLHHPTNTNMDIERALMVETAKSAMEELIRLLRMNEPFWLRSVIDGKFVLQQENYKNIFHKDIQLNEPHARIESSKDARIVSMRGTQLVDMFLNSDKWVDLFPTIVQKAHTIEVLESGLLGSRDGALQLMHAEMHILSPLVPTRQFSFLRYCKQVQVGVWAIADVSFDSSKYGVAFSNAWRHPSGCMINEMIDGSCMVTWVEHVEVDDKIQTHQLFREIICDNNSYGAERWVLTLERMCERFASASLANIPSCDAGDMPGNMELPHINSGVMVSVRNNTEPGLPNGIIVTAATSFWLPFSPENVFDFLKDNRRRAQWDVLCNGYPVDEIQHISNGTLPGNCTSIIRPSVPWENNKLILQESCIDPLGSLMVYAPIDAETLNFAMNGGDSTLLPILPFGFTISGDGRSKTVGGESGGSLLTLVNQELSCSTSAMGELNIESSVAAMNTLITSTVEKIRFALNCSNFD